MVDPPIIVVVPTYLEKVHSACSAAKRGIVFGSNGLVTPDSDKDIDFVVLSPLFDGNRDLRMTDILWEFRAVTDNDVEPFGVGERQWEEDAEITIIEIARQEGVEVQLP